MQVNSTVKFYQPAIRKLERAQIQALEQTGEWLHTEIVQAQVIPFDTGNLQNESMSVDYANSGSGEVTIKHSTVYARRLYYHPEYNFQKNSNPNAKGHWFEDWLPGGRKTESVVKAYSQIYKRISGV